jgi:hypothetical protein
VGIGDENVVAPNIIAFPLGMIRETKPQKPITKHKTITRAKTTMIQKIGNDVILSAQITLDGLTGIDFLEGFCIMGLNELA